MRVALVHDYLTHFGGAERVLAVLMDIFPNAPVYTLVCDYERLGNFIDTQRVRTSFLQNIPGARQPHRYLPLMFMPYAIEQFDLSGYDLVLSDSHSFGKGLVISPSTLHISYCFTPIRYAWDDSHRYIREFAPGLLLRGVAPFALSYIRLWDYYASQRVHHYLTLSHYVARRIKKYYRRDAQVIAPPVNLEQFSVRPGDEGYYLIVSRLVPYKRIDLAIDACEQLGRPLKIVGIGPDESVLRQRARRYTTFLGFVEDKNLPLLYQGAKALLFPQEEDFGITTLEAASCGKPTIAYRAGGALETVQPNKTGIFFDQQSVTSLKQAIIRSEAMSWDPLYIRRHAENFSRQVFISRIRQAVEDHWRQFAARSI